MKRYLLLMVCVGISISTTQAQWQQLNEPSGGHISDMALHDGATYISVANIIYKSTDNGMTWVNSRGDLPEFSDVNAIGATPTALYAGVNDSGTGDKFFVSTDGGSTWTPTGGKGATILGVDWENIGDTAFVVSNFGGVFRTVDNGITFEDMPPAGIGRTIDVWDGDLFYLGQGLVQISTDRGDNVSARIGTSSEITFNFGTMRTALRIDTTVIAGAQGVFKLNADSVWEKASAGMPLSLGNPVPVITKLALLGDWLWAFSDVGIYVSADTANTWSLLESSPQTGFVQRVKIEGTTIHMATQNGYFISNGSTDSTVTFEQRINGLNHVNVTGLHSLENSLFATAPTIGILKSDDNGESFIQFGGNISENSTTDITKSSNSFFATSGAILYNSSDGTTWTTVEGAPVSTAVAANNETLFASSGSQVYKSADEGQNWDAVSAQFQLGAAGPANYAFHDSVIFATYANLNTFGAIARSLDGGNSWQITPGAGSLTISAEVVFIGDTAYAPVTTTFTGGGVARSIDYGDTWELMSNNLNDEIGGAYEIEVYGGTLFTVSANGIWKSNDGARSWEKLNPDGLPSQVFFGGAPLTVNNGYLYYAPGNAGIFKTEIGSTSTGNELETGDLTGFRLDQNYPNPFNPSTNINFSLSESGLVSLKVYNLLGQEVAELVNQRMATGLHTINFDASGLSSGIYIYRLQAADKIQTKKMMLIK